MPIPLEHHVCAGGAIGDRAQPGLEPARPVEPRQRLVDGEEDVLCDVVHIARRYAEPPDERSHPPGVAAVDRPERQAFFGLGRRGKSYRPRPGIGGARGLNSENDIEAKKFGRERGAGAGWLSLAAAAARGPAGSAARGRGRRPWRLAGVVAMVFRALVRAPRALFTPGLGEAMHSMQIASRQSARSAQHSLCMQTSQGWVPASSP